MGLVNDVLADAVGVLMAAHAMASEIAANSPLAVQGTKAVLKACENRTIEEGLDYVGVWNAAFLQSEDLGEALTAFIEKRPAQFKGQ
jgi:enoyl-CoA hydratase